MNTEKHIKVTGYSNISWKDAIVKTVEEAGKTLNHLSTLKVLEQNARIANGKIIEYIVDLDLSFFIDPNQDNSTDNSQDADNM